MTYQGFKLFSKVAFNSISFDDFTAAGEAMEYSKEYIEIIWEDYCKDMLKFISYHDLGESIYHMVVNKMETERLLNQA